MNEWKIAVSDTADKGKVKKIVSQLKTAYPDAKCALNYKNAFQLLVATQLSAQCTDVRVNIVTQDLFAKLPAVEDFAKISLSSLENLIRSTGFYRNKAQNIKNCAKTIISQYKGKIPNQLEDLIKLDGVGRKTANVVLGNAFKVPGIVVDTHVIRLTNLLGLVQNKDAVKIEFVLMDLVAKKDWVLFSHLIIAHGRNVCIARRPRCEECVIKSLCDYYLK